jgi:hypothetical protein
MIMLRTFRLEMKLNLLEGDRSFNASFSECRSGYSISLVADFLSKYVSQISQECLNQLESRFAHQSLSPLRSRFRFQVGRVHVSTVNRLYSLDKLHLLRIMPSYYSQLEYRSLVHMSSYIGTFFMWNQISACFIFTWPEELYPFLCAIYLDLVSCLMEPTCTGQVNATCPVGSTLSW